MKYLISILVCFFSINISSQRLLFYDNEFLQLNGEFLFKELDEININSYFALHADTPLNIPTPLLDNELTHPDVIDFGVKWNGYRYWMAFTPLPEIDRNINENPCIVASNDKINWEIPIGGSNPITPTPAVSYNSDVTLFYENDTLYIFYRTWVADPTNRAIIGYKKSTDGINWSSQGEVIFLGLTDIQYQIISPSFVKYEGSYYLYASEVLQPTVNENVKIIRLTSTSITGTYSNPTYVNLDESKSLISDRTDIDHYPWHLNIKLIDDRLIGIIYYRSRSAILYQLETLFMAKSDDAYNFTVSQQPLFTRFYGGESPWDIGYYRSAFIPKYVDGELSFDLWYPGWSDDHEVAPVRIGHTEIIKKTCGLTQSDSNIINIARLNELSKANALNGYTFCDDINRANGTINPSSSGINYTIERGSFEIEDNYIKNADEAINANLQLTVPLNYEIIIQMKKGVGVPGSGSDAGLVFYPKAKATVKTISIFDSPFYAEVLKLRDVSTREIKKIYSPYKRSLLNEFKIRFEGYNIQYYCNGKLLIDHTFTAADADSQAGLDDIISQTTFYIFFTANSSAGARIKNITIKEL